MVCGQSYAEAKAIVVPYCWSGQFSHYDAFEYLDLHGFSYQHWYRHHRFKLAPIESDANRLAERSPWPIPTPFANAHILLTRGEEMGHWVAMNSDGEIFDPVRGRGKRISEYDVMQIIGIWELAGRRDKGKE